MEARGGRAREGGHPRRVQLQAAGRGARARGVASPRGRSHGRQLGAGAARRGRQDALRRRRPPLGVAGDERSRALHGDARRLGPRLRRRGVRAEPAGQGAEPVRDARQDPPPAQRRGPEAPRALARGPADPRRLRRPGPHLAPALLQGRHLRSSNGSRSASPASRPTSTPRSSTPRLRTSGSRATCGATRASSSRTCTPTSRGSDGELPGVVGASSSASGRTAERSSARPRRASTRSASSPTASAGCSSSAALLEIREDDAADVRTSLAACEALGEPSRSSTTRRCSRSGSTARGGTSSCCGTATSCRPARRGCLPPTPVSRSRSSRGEDSPGRRTCAAGERASEHLEEPKGKLREQGLDPAS